MKPMDDRAEECCGLREKQNFSVAAYIRLSREDGDREESDSVGNQKKLLSDFIGRQGDLLLYDFYVDDGFTGTSFDRPAFRRMLGDIEQGAVNCVAVKDLSRFGRDYIDTGRYLERCFPELGVRFISVCDGIDSQKQSYDMMLPIKNVFNEQYARDISGKIHATLTAKQKAGEFIGAFPSYGYRKSPSDKNRLVIDEYPAGIVRRIFSLYLQGYGKQRIASLLNEEGVLCPAEYKKAMGMHYRNPNRLSGMAHWTYSTVNSILHREIYTGNMVQGTKYQQMRGHQKSRPRDRWIIVENTHEPVIDRATWENVQHLLRSRTKQPVVPSPANPFAGLVRCGDCGRSMAKNTWKHADGATVCRLYCGTYRRHGSRYCTPHAVPLNVLKKIVADDLRTLLQKFQAVSGKAPAEVLAAQIRKRSAAGSRQAPPGVSPDKGLRRELDRIRTLKQTLYEDFRDALISREDYLSFRESYQQRELLLRRQLELLEQQKSSGRGESSFVLPSPEQLLRLVTPESLTRELTAELIREIRIYENHRVRITYSFSPEIL